MTKRNMRQRTSIEVHPPKLVTTVEIRRTFRFQSTNATTTVISNNNILGALGVCGYVTNSLGRTMTDAFKLHRVRLWGPTVSGTATTVSILWNSASIFESSSNKLVTDTSVSESYPAFVDSVPPLNSNSAFWQTASSSGLLYLTVPVGGIIDIDVSYTLCDGAGGGVGITLATVVLGTYYYLALDGPTTAHYTPIGLATTV